MMLTQTHKCCAPAHLKSYSQSYSLALCQTRVPRQQGTRPQTQRLLPPARVLDPQKFLDPQTPENPISAQGLSVQSVTTALLHASRAWDKYDHDKSGQLCLKETVDLLNSHELQDAALLLTNVAPTVWHSEELRPLFEKADNDRSGALSKSEFLALYLSVTTQRVQKNPLVLAEALLGFLDTDRNGRIEGKELKVLLTMLGFPVAMVLPIPARLGVDYRSILRSLAPAISNNGNMNNKNSNNKKK